MNREIKLALILSFVLILVLGVLVSDYYSQANEMEPDRLDLGLTQPIVQLPGAERARMDSAIDRVMPTERGPAMIANRSTGSNGSTGSAGSLLRGLSNGISRNMEELNAPALAASTNSPTNSPVEIQNRNAAPVQALGRIQHEIYTVREGDSLYRIAARKLGDGNRWREVQKLNQKLVGDDGLIAVGMTLKLPANARVSTPKARTTRQAVVDQKSQSVETYTVVSGDTLGEISMKLLGTSKRMGEFVALNGLDDADDIRVGMTLKVPGR